MLLERSVNTAGSRVVHIVDDDAAVRDSMRALLESYSLTVHVYASAREFLAANPAGYSGCLLADLHMPEMNGIELLETLRDGGLIGPALVMTGRGDFQLRDIATKAGALAVLDKPIDCGRLQAVIENALSSASQT